MILNRFTSSDNPANHSSGSAPKAGKRGLGESVPEPAWRKFHKVTPLAQGGALWVILAIIVFNIVMQIVEGGMTDVLAAVVDVTVAIVLIILGVLLGLTLIVIFFSWVSWRYQSFAIVDSGVHKRSGIAIAYWYGGPTSFLTEQAINAAIAAVGSLAMTVLAVIGERWCMVDDDEGQPESTQAAGA